MILGISEDFSSDVQLDSQITAIPQSGLYLNSGTHPSITVENLLEFLSFYDFVFSDYNDETTYTNYSLTKKRTDIVKYESKIYQSLSNANVGNLPTEENSIYWLETNIESLKIKNHIDKVKDKVYSELNLTKRLINNQYIYNAGPSQSFQLPNDYSAWIFEPKGSDYVTFRINQISFQKLGTTPVNLYVVNQGVLVDTLQITPSNGIVDFKDLNYTFTGKGKWIFAIDSTEVIGSSSYVDPLKFNGFLCYTAVGIGSEPETAVYSYGNSNNGIGFNISVFLDSSIYIENNLNELANFVRATFELETLKMFLHNSNNRSNRSQTIQLDKDMLIAETKSLDMNTAAKRFQDEKRKALRVMSRTFDTQLLESDDSDFEIEMSSL